MGRARARRIPAQLVEDEDYQLRHERVAGTGIAKAKADVCTRLPPARDGGRRASRVEDEIGAALDAMPAAWGASADGETGPDAGRGPDAAALPAVSRVAGCST
mgnify:CR=1 FL=1